MDKRTEADDSFRTVSALWLAEKEAAVKQSTVEGYRKNLRKHLLPAFGDMKVSEISPDRASAFLEMLTTEGSPGCPPVSANTAMAVLTQLRSILDYAVKEHGCMVQSLYGVRMTKKEKPLRILTREEEQRLRRVLTGDLNRRNLGILLCLDTGMRLGELCALIWEDVSENGRSILIRRTVTRLPARGTGAKTLLQITSPKGDQSIRTVPVPEEDAALLRQFRAADETFLLTGEAESFADNRTIQYYLKRVLKRLGMEEVGFNDLRDTFAVRYLEGGGSILRLSEILGHINVAFTAGHYLPFVSDEESAVSASENAGSGDQPASRQVGINANTERRPNHAERGQGAMSL